MGEPSSAADFFDKGGDDQSQFAAWATPQLSNDVDELHQLMRSAQGDVVSPASALRIMDRWTAKK